MKTYSSKANATRAAVTELSKGTGLTKDEVKAQKDTLFTIEAHDEGGFYWRRIQTEQAEPVQVEPTVEETAEIVEAVEHDLAAQEKEAQEFVKPKRKRDAGAVARCWNFYDANKELTRKEAVDAMIKDGTNKWTARTQYQCWFKALKSSQNNQGE